MVEDLQILRTFTFVLEEQNYFPNVYLFLYLEICYLISNEAKQHLALPKMPESICSTMVKYIDYSVRGPGF